MSAQESEKKTGSRKKWSIGCLLGFVLFCVAFYFMVGIFVIQPIGAVPEGKTILFWRFDTNMPFISSADGLLLDNDENVSLLGRGVVLAAVAEAIEDKIIVRLPYMKFLYLLSTGGKEFEQ